MNEKEMMEALAQPFAANEVEWRAQRVGITNNRPWAMVLCYLTNRAIMNRLDHVFGLANWRNEYIKWGDKSTLCGISCKINGEWITKYDGAEETDIEAVKGGFSDAMKRAAVQWGMGRYLYNLEESFTECSLEKQTGPEWRKAVTSDNQILFWKSPTLPAWALPKTEKPAPPKDPKNPTRKTENPPPPQSAPQQPAPPAAPPATTTPPPPQAPAPNETEVMLRFMADRGVSRNDLENLINAKVENFTTAEKQKIKDAIAKMRRDKTDFFTAFNSL